MINIIIVTHGDFGAYLVEAAEWIVGEQTQGIAVVGVSPRAALNEVKHAINKALSKNMSADGVVFLTDMLGGTPTNIVLPLTKDLPKSAVISGVNINMLISAFSYRTTLNFQDLINKIIDDGRKAVCDVNILIAKQKEK